MPNKSTLNWGVNSAIGFIAVYAVLLGIMFISPDSSFGGFVTSAVFFIASPVGYIWKAVGVTGDAGIGLIIPIIISVFLYLAGLGFVVGILSHRIIGSR
jgi:hypothetical protein